MTETSVAIESVGLTRASTRSRSARRLTIPQVVAASRDSSLLGCGVIASFIAGATTNGTVPMATAATVIALLPVFLLARIGLPVPNQLLVIATSIGVVAAIATASPDAPMPVGHVAVGAALMAAPLLIAHLVAPSTLGAADARVAAVLGGALGLIDPVAGLVAIAAGATVTVAYAIVRRRPVALFAPGLLAGTTVVIAAVAWS